MEERQSVEEMYEYSNRYHLVKCDVCKERTPSTRIYTFERFQDDTTLIVCGRCMGRLKKEGD